MIHILEAIYIYFQPKNGFNVIQINGNILSYQQKAITDYKIQGRKLTWVVIVIRVG